MYLSIFLLQPIHQYNRHFTSLSISKLTKKADINSLLHQETSSLPEEVIKMC